MPFPCLGLEVCMLIQLRACVYAVMCVGAGSQPPAWFVRSFLSFPFPFLSFFIFFETGSLKFVQQTLYQSLVPWEHFHVSMDICLSYLSRRTWGARNSECVIYFCLQGGVSVPIWSDMDSRYLSCLKSYMEALSFMTILESRF